MSRLKDLSERLTLSGNKVFNNSLDKVRAAHGKTNEQKRRAKKTDKTNA